MNVLEAALTGLARDLDDLGSRWALVGGFATSARAEPRFTRDVDVVVAVPDDATAETLVHALVQRGYRPLASVEQEATAHLATVRLASRVGADDDLVVDVLLASSGVESEIVTAADRLDVMSGLTVPVAQVGDLIALKLLARDDETRPQDAQDLRALATVAQVADLDRADLLVQMIISRGYGRDRDLIGALAAYRAEHWS